MSDTTFSVVTAIYTVGGLIGSMSANIAMDRWGRRGASRLSALMTAVGALLMAVSSSVKALLVGRCLAADSVFKASKCVMIYIEQGTCRHWSWPWNLRWAYISL